MFQPRTAEDKDKAEKRLLKRQAQRKRKLEETGIKYDFETVAYVSFLTVPTSCQSDPVFNRVQKKKSKVDS